LLERANRVAGKRDLQASSTETEAERQRQHPVRPGSGKSMALVIETDVAQGLFSQSSLPAATLPTSGNQELPSEVLLQLLNAVKDLSETVRKVRLPERNCFVEIYLSLSESLCRQVNDGKCRGCCVCHGKANGEGTVGATHPDGVGGGREEMASMRTIRAITELVDNFDSHPPSPPDSTSSESDSLALTVERIQQYGGK
jgi:hypothetical protein